MTVANFIRLPFFPLENQDPDDCSSALLQVSFTHCPDILFTSEDNRINRDPKYISPFSIMRPETAVISEKLVCTHTMRPSSLHSFRTMVHSLACSVRSILARFLSSVYNISHLALKVDPTAAGPWTRVQGRFVSRFGHMLTPFCILWPSNAPALFSARLVLPSYLLLKFPSVGKIRCF